MSDELEQEAIAICSDLSGEARCVNMKSLKKIFVSDEVMHQSLQGRLWCPEAQENRCVKIRLEAQVAHLPPPSLDINHLAHAKLISQHPSILYS